MAGSVEKRIEDEGFLAAFRRGGPRIASVGRIEHAWRGGLLGFMPGLPQARGVILTQFGQGPGQGADQGWAVHASDPESSQVPACQDHPGEPAAMRAPVMPGDDQLVSSVTPLRRQDPDLRAGREMLHPAPQLQAALAVRGLLRDVRHDAEDS